MLVVDGKLVTFTASASIAGLAAAFLLGNLRDPTLSRVGLALTLGSSALLIYNGPDHSAADLVFTPLMFGIGWLAGFALRERAEEAEAAEARAAQAEREREAAARLAVAEGARADRARAPRHVAHAVSVMVLQVGAIRHNLPETVAEDKDALQGVERTGRAALTEMRRLLGAMRDEGQDAELAPQPGLDSLESLLDEVGRAGLHVQLHREGEPSPLPRAIELSAYRIIQEGLTNALKHAQASHADVTLRYGPDELQLEIRDDGRGVENDGLGHGLVGVRGARQDLRRRDELWTGEQAASSASANPSRRRSMVRAGFRMLLAGEADIEVVAEASNGLEAVEKAAQFASTVVLMDIRMPELDGLEAARRILAADETARISSSRRSTWTSTSTRRFASARTASCSRTTLPSS